MDREELIKKRTKLFLLKCSTGNDLVQRFMNDENDKMMDEKIEVCQRLIDGEKIEDIPNFYEVLDDMPKDDEGIITDW